MKNLVVIADPAGGKNSALKRALEIKEKTNASVTVLAFTHVNVEDPEDLEDAGLTIDDLHAAALEKRHKETASELKKLNVKKNAVSTEVIWSKDVAGDTVEFCKQNNADLVFKSGHRSETFLYTSTDWQLFRQSGIPVMITTGKSWRKKSRVLAAVDFTTRQKTKQKLNDRIVEQARFMADALGDQVHLVYAITAPQALVDLDVIDARSYATQKRKKLQPVVEAFCEKHNLDPGNVHLKVGAPGRIIPSVANSLKADLVVTGTIGRKGVKGKLIGNTAETVLSKLHSDILTVTP